MEPVSWEHEVVHSESSWDWKVRRLQSPGRQRVCVLEGEDAADARLGAGNNGGGKRGLVYA